MNPYSFNVEVYHKRISTHPHPRDILSPNIPPNPRKVRSFIKFLGTLANRKSCAVVAGGIIAVGSFQMVRKGLQWLCRKRSTASKEKKDAASHTEAGTQTDSPEKLLSSDHDSPIAFDAKTVKEASSTEETGSNCMEGRAIPRSPSADVDQSQIPKTVSMEELRGNSSLINETSDHSIAPGCQCIPKSREENIQQGTQPVHPFCQLSIAIALLALQKACSCVRCDPIANTCDQHAAWKENDRSPTGNNWKFNPGMKPFRTIIRKTNDFSMIDKSGFDITDQSRNKFGPSKQKTSLPKTPFPFSQTATRRSRPSENYVNQLEKQKPVSSGRRTQIGEDQPSRTELERGSFAGQPSPKKETRTNYPVTDTRNENRSKAAPEQPTRQTNVAGSSAEQRTEEGGLLQRGKPKRRGGRRKKNIRRRQYVDLDNPNQVASQHRFQKWARQRALGETI